MSSYSDTEYDVYERHPTGSHAGETSNASIRLVYVYPEDSYTDDEDDIRIHRVRPRPRRPGSPSSSTFRERSLSIPRDGDEPSPSRHRPTSPRSITSGSTNESEFSFGLGGAAGSRPSTKRSRRSPSPRPPRRSSPLGETTIDNADGGAGDAPLPDPPHNPFQPRPIYYTHGPNYLRPSASPPQTRPFYYTHGPDPPYPYPPSQSHQRSRTRERRRTRRPSSIGSSPSIGRPVQRRAQRLRRVTNLSASDTYYSSDDGFTSQPRLRENPFLFPVRNDDGTPLSMDINLTSRANNERAPNWTNTRSEFASRISEPLFIEAASGYIDETETERITLTLNSKADLTSPPNLRWM